MGASAVYIAGVGITPFGDFRRQSLPELARPAIEDALADAGIDKSELNVAYMGNAAGSVISGQTCIPGQAVLRRMGIGKIPVINVENACATSATALQQAYSLMSLGAYDIALICGYEKLYHDDKLKTFSVFSGAIDVSDEQRIIESLAARNRACGFDMDSSGAGKTRSLFIDIYATWAREHMARFGTTQRQIAAVSAKNSKHGSLNPVAQFKSVLSVDDVLGAKEIVSPLTLPMCAPIGDGAAALVLVSERVKKRLTGNRCIRILGSTLTSGWDVEANEAPIVEQAANALYEQCGVGPTDLDCIELHDASAISEICYYEYLGLCDYGAGGHLVESGATSLGGKIPVNTSGGLMRKGHPIGATGAAQIVELTQQLRGEAGDRQVDNPRVALAENGGGYLGQDVAALVLTLLGKD